MVTSQQHHSLIGRTLMIKERYNIPVGWTTDVNAAALGEFTEGAAKGLNSCVYTTVGTGISDGGVINNHL
jgi:fructokinase